MITNPTETLALVAAIAALGAFWVSLREARRNNKVMVKLSKFNSHSTFSAAGNAYELEVWVLNCGIQMQDISMALCFRGPGKSGHCSVPIPLANHSKCAASTFLRGTTAKFLLSTADKNASSLVGMLRDFKEQRPVICVYNSSFLACSFPIYSRWDCFRRLWNKLSSRFMFKRRVGDGIDGKGVFKMYPLQYFAIRSERLQSFLDGVRKTGADDTCSS